jgi:dolichyl-phosphate-mannose--protein O-mannosyl transferase
MLDFATYTQWSGILTILFLVLTVLAFLFQWGLRFRLVGVTGFMVVLTIGIFGLSLGLFDRPQVSGAVHFARVYDNGTNQIVITVPPTINKSELEATLKQAANNFFSYGRTGETLTIRARTIIHPQPGSSKPLYLGQIKRSLLNREGENFQVEIFTKNLAQLN